MNWVSEREREISLSTVRHHPHFEGWDQYNQKIQNMMDNRDIISSTAWEKEFIFNQGF